MKLQVGKNSTKSGQVGRRRKESSGCSSNTTTATGSSSSIFDRERIRVLGLGILVGIVSAVSLQNIWFSSLSTSSITQEVTKTFASPQVADAPTNRTRIDNASSTTASKSDWPGIPKEEIGHPLVAKSTNFVANARQLTFDYLDEFLDAYEKRPDPINICGIRINHALALFLAIKVLQPTAIIESGVNAGQSTYFMRAAAAPTTKIYAIDPLDKPICDQSVRWIDQVNTEYYTGNKFQDITEIDWESKIRNKEVDPDKTLVFLDDHLVVFDRIGILLQHGFRHVLLEDNYKIHEGATSKDKAGFTPKQMFARQDDDVKFLWHNMVSYAEFPPLVAPILAKENNAPRKKAGGFIVAADTNTDIVEPILRAESNAEDMKVYRKICERLKIDPVLKDIDSYMQMMNYNQIAYFELVPLAPRLRPAKAAEKRSLRR